MSDEVPVLDPVEIEYVIPVGQTGGPSVRHAWGGLALAGNTHAWLTIVQEIDITNGTTYGPRPIPWDWINEAVYAASGEPVVRPPALG